MSEIARNWIETLAARGVSVTLRNNRLTFSPPRAYTTLTDDERATLRAHRRAIKDLADGRFVLAGPLEGTTTTTAQHKADPENVEPSASGQAVWPNPAIEPSITNCEAEPGQPSESESTCRFCYRSPCVGKDHPAYTFLHRDHPDEIAKREMKELLEMAVTMQHSGRRRGYMR